MSVSLSRSALARAPEALTLEVLAVAVTASQKALLAVHPDLDELSAHYEGVPPPSILLAAQLVARLDELRDLLSWYQRSCCTPSPLALNHDPF
jgi:hypothetical protein